MAYSVQKSRPAKVAGVSLVLLLAACSSDSRYKRQVSGDEAYRSGTACGASCPGWNDFAGDLRRLCNPGDQR